MKVDNLKIEEQIIKLERDWAVAETAIIENKNIQNSLANKIKELKKIISNQSNK